MVYCWRGEGCGQERARESKDDRLGSSTGSLLANCTTGVIRRCLGDEHREILGVLPLVVTLGKPGHFESTRQHCSSNTYRLENNRVEILVHPPYS